jgi:voltage-gated potassium channel
VVLGVLGSLGPVPLRAVSSRTDPVERLFQALVTAIVAGVTLVVAATDSIAFGPAAIRRSMDRASPAPDATLRRRVAFYLRDHHTPAGKAVDVSLLLLNLAFIGVFVLDTYPLAPATRAALRTVEVGIALVFAAEYAVRVYAAPERLAEVRDPYTVVDLVAVLPTLAGALSPGLFAAATSVGVLQLLRLVRVLRFFRFTRDEEFFFGTVSQETLRSLTLLLTILSIFFVTAGLFYTVEHEVNPAVATFGDAFYFAVVSLTTVGFGDITPTTSAGRWVTVFAILAAVILVPRQASRIVREWTGREEVGVTCPQCGLSVHDEDASHCKACGHVIYQEFDDRE